jgi:hypothetical protein
MKDRPIVAIVLVLAVFALSACGSVPRSSASVPAAASATLRVDLSSFSPCDHIADEDAQAIVALDIGAGEEHLSALPGFRDCVFFAGNSAIVSVGLRQEPTAAETVEALLLGLFPADKDAASVTVGQVPAQYLSCAHVWSPCTPAIAFVSEPYFFVIHFRTPADDEEVGLALASAVLANLKR